MVGYLMQVPGRTSQKSTNMTIMLKAPLWSRSAQHARLACEH